MIVKRVTPQIELRATLDDIRLMRETQQAPCIFQAVERTHKSEYIVPLSFIGIPEVRWAYIRYHATIREVYKSVWWYAFAIANLAMPDNLASRADINPK